MNVQHRPRLADPHHCPWCGARLAGPWCGRCGLRLEGDLALKLWSTSQEADRLLDERQKVLLELRERSLQSAQSEPAARPQRAARPQPATPPQPARPVPPIAAPVNRDLMITGEGGSAKPKRTLGMQTLLVGVGALLLAVAAIVFLAFSWDLLGITGRSIVVAGLTLAVLGLAVLARRANLGATAEAVAAFGVVLVLLDSAAVRATGLAGTGMGLLAYAALAAAVCAVLLAGYGIAGRLRAATISAAVLAPLAPVLAGLHIADRPGLMDGGSATAIGLGLVAGSAVGLLRGAVPNLMERLRAERAILAIVAAVLCGAAAPLPVAAALMDGAGLGAVLAVAVGLVAIAHGTLDAGNKDRHIASAGLAGIETATAAALATIALSSAGVVAGEWQPLLLPLTTGVVVLALAALGRARENLAQLTAARAGIGALGVFAVASLPAFLISAGLLVQVLGAAAAPWRSDATDTLAEAAAIGPDGGLETAFTTDLRISALVGALVVAAVLVCRWLLGRRHIAWLVLATLAAGTALVCLPWQPELMLLVAVVAGIVVFLAVAAAAVAVERRPDARDLSGVVAAMLVVASFALTAAVLASWAAKWLSVPVTLVGALALLAAWRRHRSAGPLLLPGTALTLLICLGAVGRWAGMSGMDAVLLAAAAGGLAVVAGLYVPRLELAERRSLIVTGGVPLVAFALVAFRLGLYASGDLVSRKIDMGTAPRPQVLLVAVVITAVLLAIQPRLRVERMVGAGIATAAVAALAVSAAAEWTGWPLPLASAAAVALGALVTAALARANDPRRQPVETVNAAVAVLTLLALAAGSADTAWPVLLVLAGAAAVTATAPARRWAGWVAFALATVALWLRLSAGGVGLVEAYTLPPALVLAVLAVLAWRRGRAALTPTALGATVLAVLPTAVAGINGPQWRPIAVLVVAAVLVLAVVALVEAKDLDVRHGSGPVDPQGGAGAAPDHTGDEQHTRERDLARLLLGTVAIATLVGPTLRALAEASSAIAGAVQPAVPELWAVPAALVLGVAAMPATHLVPTEAARHWLGAPAVLALVVPVLLVASTPGRELARVLGLLVVLGAVAVGATIHRTPPLGASLRYLALGLGAFTALAGVLRDTVGPVELVTVPFAVTVLAVGVLEMRRKPRLGSWPWIGPGTTLLLVPSLLASFVDSHPARVAGLALGATGVLVAGAVLRWKAPLLLGAAVLVVHAVVQLAPWIALAYATVPRWVSLGLAGAVLLALGARYEQRLRDVRSVRHRVAAMR